MNLHLTKALETYLANIESSKMECITIKAQDTLTQITDSKFGGHPFLPIDVEYPKDYDDRPMIFLAQINFAELPVNRLFPKEGILQFYVADDDNFGKSYDNPILQKGFKVLFFNNSNSAYQNDFSFLNEYERECPPFKDLEPFENRLYFSNEMDYVPYGSIDFDRFFGEDGKDFRNMTEASKSLRDSYIEAIDLKNCGHKLGGYPRFIQDDPRNKYNAYQHYVTLLQIDSQDHFMWGDGGRSHFLIDKDHLKNKDFTKVLYYWSCL